MRECEQCGAAIPWERYRAKTCSEECARERKTEKQKQQREIFRDAGLSVREMHQFLAWERAVSAARKRALQSEARKSLKARRPRRRPPRASRRKKARR